MMSQIPHTFYFITKSALEPFKNHFEGVNRMSLCFRFLSFSVFYINYRVLIYQELGNFSITGIEISFKRHKFKYIYVYYLPSGLFVVVSWVSFLIPPEVIPGRMAMLITLFLVLINIFNVSTKKVFLGRFCTSFIALFFGQFS